MTVESRLQSLRALYGNSMPALLDRDAVFRVIGKLYSNTHLLAMEARGAFPRRVSLSPRRTVWPLDEILLWVAQQLEGDREAAMDKRRNAVRGAVDAQRVTSDAA